MNVVLYVFFLALLDAFKCNSIGENIVNFIESGLSDRNCTEQVAVTVGVVSKGATIVAKTMGMRDIERELKANDNTLFGIGSTTKAMTAIITKKVLEKNNYTWDTPISQFYQDFKLHSTITDKVTFRDLYSHRTCLRRDDFWWSSGPDTFNLDIVAKKMKNILLIDGCTFRKNFNYNNLLYVYGAYIIEKIAAKPWAKLIQEELFDPLGMTSTKAYFREAKEANNWLVGYDVADNEFKPLPENADKIIDKVGQAGSIHSTPTDMIKYMKYILENKEVFEDLFWQKSVDVGSSMSPVKLDNGRFPVDGSLDEYSVAWALGDYRDEEVLAHGGNTFTTHTFITLNKQRDYGIFLSNTGSAKATRAVQLITWYIQDLLMDKEPWLNKTTYCSFPEPWKEKEKKDKEDFLDGYTSSLNLDNTSSYVGSYEHHVFGKASITVDKDGSLFFQFNKINCTLYVKNNYKNTFRCLALVPWLLSDVRTKQHDRMLSLKYNPDEDTISTDLADEYIYTFTRSSVSIHRPLKTLTVVVIAYFLSSSRTFA